MKHPPVRFPERVDGALFFPSEKLRGAVEALSAQLREEKEALDSEVVAFERHRALDDLKFRRTNTLLYAHGVQHGFDPDPIQFLLNGGRLLFT